MTENTKSAEPKNTLRHRLMQKSRERHLEMLAEVRRRAAENAKHNA